MIIVFLGVLFIVLIFEMGIYIGKRSVYRKIGPEINVLVEDIRRFKSNFEVMCLWRNLQEQGGQIKDFLMLLQNKKVALYGYGQIGMFIEKEMKEAGVSIEYIIDRNAKNISSGYKVYTLDDELPFVDCVIVTINDSFVIERKFEENGNYCKMIMVKEMLNFLMDNTK